MPHRDSRRLWLESHNAAMTRRKTRLPAARFFRSERLLAAPKYRSDTCREQRSGYTWRGPAGGLRCAVRRYGAYRGEGPIGQATLSSSIHPGERSDMTGAGDWHCHANAGDRCC